MVGNGTRQTPLILEPPPKHVAKELGARLGLNETGVAIVIAICRVNDWVSYSRTSQHYSQPRRYRTPLYTFRKVVGQVDHLDCIGLIEHDRRLPGVRGWQSALKATTQLHSMVAEVLCGPFPKRLAPREPLILRDTDGKPRDYRETRQTTRWRRDLDLINEVVLGSDLETGTKAPIARIFNRSFRRGGRVYALGPSWQNISKRERAMLMLGGERLVEIDYRNMHPAMLYSEVGVDPPTDCYDVPGWSRDVVKRALLIMINARHTNAAICAIATHCQVPGETPHERRRSAQQLIKLISHLHGPISGAFFHDAGGRLMHADASIAVGVVKRLLKRGTLALPVHDSFLVPASESGQLRETMLAVAGAAGYPRLRVDG